MRSLSNAKSTKSRFAALTRVALINILAFFKIFSDVGLRLAVDPKSLLIPAPASSNLFLPGVFLPDVSTLNIGTYIIRCHPSTSFWLSSPPSTAKLTMPWFHLRYLLKASSNCGLFSSASLITESISESVNLN